MKLTMLLLLPVATMVVAFKDGVATTRPFLHGKTHKQAKTLKKIALAEISLGVVSPTPSTSTPTFESPSLIVLGKKTSSSYPTGNYPTQSPVIITNTPTQSVSVESDGNDDEPIGTNPTPTVQASTDATTYTFSTTSSALSTTSSIASSTWISTSSTAKSTIYTTIQPPTSSPSSITSMLLYNLTNDSKEGTQTPASHPTLPVFSNNSSTLATIEETSTASTQLSKQLNNNSNISDDETKQVGSNSVQRSIELSFYYQIETTTFDDEILEDVESALIAGMCGSSNNYLRRLLMETSQVVGFNSNPKDTVSTENVCRPTYPNAQLCTVVEGGMTLDYVEDEGGEEDDETIEAYAYEKIEEQFTLLSIDDSRVVAVTYIGDDTSSLVPITPSSDGLNEEDTSAKYYPSPFVVTLSGALFVALLVGLYHIKGRTSDDDTTPAVKGLYAIDDDKSHAHETVANTTYNTSFTSLYRGNQRNMNITHPVDSTITFPGHQQSKVLNNLSSPNSISRAPIHCPADANEVQYQHASSFIINEHDETRSEWRRLGILPEVVTKHATIIREEEESI